MNLNHLRVFVAVARELHFGKTARRHNMTQQAVSAAIRRLEEEICVPLFDRTTRKVMLTPAGEAFLKEAEAALSQLDRGCESARRIVNEAGDRLLIGYSGTALFDLFPNILREFSTLYPGTKIGFQRESAPRIFALLRSGRLDAAFTHPLGDFKQLQVQCLKADRLMLAMPRGHRLEALDCISAADVQRENLIGFLREGAEAEEPIGLLFNALAGGCKMVYFAESSTDIIELVSLGLGISIALESATSKAAEGVSYRPLVLPAVYHVLATRIADRSPPVSALRRIASRYMDASPNYRASIDWPAWKSWSNTENNPMAHSHH